MATGDAKFLFDLNGQVKRPVYLLPASGILMVESDFGGNDYKAGYEVFADSYKRPRNLFTVFRDIFHRSQAGLYVIDRTVIQEFLARALTYVPRISSYGNFLDVGCNTGSFLSKTPDVWKKYGVEISKSAYEEARKNTSLTVFNTGFEEMPTLVKFDFLRLSHVIEHVIDYDMFLEKMKEITNGKGHALIYTPNTNSLSYLLFKKHWAGFFEKTHVNLFNLKNLGQICERHGFTVVEKGTYYMGMSAGSLILFLGINPDSGSGKLLYVLFFTLFYPFSFLVNALRLGGALYIYVKKDE